MYLDAAETFWQQWVVGYDPNHQGTLADRIEQAARRLGIGWFDSLSGAQSRWIARAKAWLRRFGLPAAAGAGGRVLAVNRRPEAVAGVAHSPPRGARAPRRGEHGGRDPALRRMLRVLKRRGYQKPAWFTPAEFARSLPAPLGRAVEEFTLAYNALRFGGRIETAPRLSTLLDELERSAR